MLSALLRLSAGHAQQFCSLVVLRFGLRYPGGACAPALQHKEKATKLRSGNTVRIKVTQVQLSHTAALSTVRIETCFTFDKPFYANYVSISSWVLQELNSLNK